MAKMDEGADLEFKWLKKRGVGGKKKEILVYESFIYDGVMYTLYDCVYMYKEGLSEPYIGKLIKIWEHSDKTRKVKVHWFFRIDEISQWLGDAKTLEKEILLASGEGVGLANVNPLEAIAGHCNVVCVSKDCRNPQPSDEELKAADYVFYRSFDVQSCTVLDKMDDKVGGLEIQYIFNRKKSENTSTVPKLNPVKEEENKNTTSNEPHQILTKAPSDKPDTVKVDGRNNQLTVEVDGKGDSQRKDVQNSLESLSAVEPCSEAAMDSCKVGTSAEKGKTDRCIVNSDKVKMKKAPVNQVEAKERNKTVGSKALNDGSLKTDEADNDEVKVSKLPVNKVETKEKNISPANSDKLQGRSSKQNKPDDSIKSPEGQQVEVNKKNRKSGMDSDKSKDMSSNTAKIDDSIKLPADDEYKHEEKSPLHHDEGKAIVTSDTSKEKPDHRNGKDLVGPDKEVTPTRIIGDLEGRTLKKAKVGNSSKVSDNNKDSAVQKLSTSIKGKNGKDAIATVAFNKNDKAVQKPNGNIQGQNGKDAIAPVTSSEEEPKSRLALGSLEINEEPSREHLGERKRKLSVGKSPTVLVPSSAIGEFKRPKNQEIVVKPKPNADKNNWFKTLPWDDRLQGAYDQGTVVLLHNLDSGYTSGEVEDIIWNALKEKCDAKMLQRTALSAPHCGQALILLKTKEATERVLERLDNECLMLPNGRPLVGTSCPAISSRKQSKFFGHLVIPKLKTQNQREMDEAVSTSHPSQPNTIEYEMAMEWCLQHSRSEKWLEAIYKQQLDELRKLDANLKQK